MTIETLNAIKSEAVNLQASLDVLNIRISDYEFAASTTVPAEVNNAWISIQVNLTTILDWVEQAIDNGTEEPELTAMRLFLNELKAVFDKYYAVLERIDGSAYGTSYGGADFFRVTVIDPVSGEIQTKDIVPAIANAITSADLV